MAENTNPFNAFNIFRNFIPGMKSQLANPNGLTPDGTVVSRVRRRDERGNSDVMEALVKIFGAMLGKEQRNNTPENLRALRNDPIGDSNKARQDPRNPEMAQGNNRLVPGYGWLGPNTAAMAEAGLLTPEQLAKMQGRTAMNQWRFPDMFKQMDAQNVAGVVAEHNQGVDYIKEQQSQMLPTVDFRERNPNLSGQYQGTNVRDFLIDQSRRQNQAQADGFDAAPPNAIKSIIPKASHGTTPGYATYEPRPVSPMPLLGLRLPSSLPTMPLPSPAISLGKLFGPTFKPEALSDNPGVMPKTDWNAVAAQLPPSNEVGFAFGADGLSYPDQSGTQYDKDGYRVVKGQKYDKQGRPVYGPTQEDIGRSFRSLFN